MKKLILISVISVSLCLALTAGGRQETEAGVSSAAFKGVVAYMEGDVTVDGNPAELGQEISRGATVQTGPGSYCEIIFGGKNVFRIQEETLADIRIDRGIGQIDMKTGSLGLVLNKLSVLENDENFTITTPTAVASVRGTAFFVKVISEEDTYICICNGTLDTSDNEKGEAITTSANHHKAYSYLRGTDGKVTYTPAPMLYHNDDDMDRLAAKIDYEIPWKGSYEY